MGRVGDPRVTVRFSPEEHEMVERAARVAGIETGALVRVCAVRWGAVLAANLRSGNPRLEGERLRRRSQ